MVIQIIERSLPKKPKVMKDPSVIEREEMEKISKFWVNIARKEIPKHHKVFTNYHRKQITDAKRVSETCQREVCVVLFAIFLFLFYCLALFPLLPLYTINECFNLGYFQVKMKVSRSLK